MAFLRYPVYYKCFKCKGGDCTDTCCQKWEIDIDEKTAERYKKEKSPIGEKIRSAIGENDDGRYIKLNSKGLCPLLAENGLCSIILEKGEDFLCDICRMHPRYFGWYSRWKEAGVGLCCEAAAELILNCTDFALCQESFIDSGNELEYENDGEIEDFLFEKREILLNAAQKRIENNESVQSLFDRCLNFAHEFFDEYTDLIFYTDPETADNNQNMGKFENIYTADSIRQIREFFSGLDIENLRWMRLIEGVYQNAGEISGYMENFHRQNPWVKDKIISLFAYFIYRHFMRAYDDDDIYAKINFAVLSRGFIDVISAYMWLKDGCFEMKTLVNIAKLYSQEIEYDIDNTYRAEKFNIF